MENSIIKKEVIEVGKDLHAPALQGVMDDSFRIMNGIKAFDAFRAGLNDDVRIAKDAYGEGSKEHEDAKDARKKALASYRASEKMYKYPSRLAGLYAVYCKFAEGRGSEESLRDAVNDFLADAYGVKVAGGVVRKFFLVGALDAGAKNRSEGCYVKAMGLDAFGKVFFGGILQTLTDAGRVAWDVKRKKQEDARNERIKKAREKREREKAVAVNTVALVKK